MELLAKRRLYIEEFKAYYRLWAALEEFQSLPLLKEFWKTLWSLPYSELE